MPSKMEIFTQLRAHRGLKIDWGSLLLG